LPREVRVHELTGAQCSCGYGDGVRRAPAPAPPIPKARVGAGLVASVVAGKYLEAMPLYRSVTFYQWHGVELERQALARWCLVAADLVAPVIDRLHVLLLTRRVIHFDQTPVQVLQ